MALIKTTISYIIITILQNKKKYTHKHADKQQRDEEYRSTCNTPASWSSTYHKGIMRAEIGMVVDVKTIPPQDTEVALT